MLGLLVLFILGLWLLLTLAAMYADYKAGKGLTGRTWGLFWACLPDLCC